MILIHPEPEKVISETTTQTSDTSLTSHQATLESSTTAFDNSGSSESSTNPNTTNGVYFLFVVLNFIIFSIIRKKRK